MKIRKIGVNDALYVVVAAVLRRWPGGVTKTMLGSDLGWPDNHKNRERLTEQLNRLIEAGYIKERAATADDEPGGNTVWTLTAPGWQYSLGCKYALLLLNNIDIGD